MVWSTVICCVREGDGRETGPWNLSISCPARTIPRADGGVSCMPLLAGTTAAVSVGAVVGTVAMNVSVGRRLIDL